MKSKSALFVLLIPIVIIIAITVYTNISSNSAHQPITLAPKAKRPHVDHSALIQDSLTDGPSVTRTCLTCHPNAASEIMKTTHWTWSTDSLTVPWNKEKIVVGKKYSYNNFCIGIAGGNESMCTKCHAGYGWKDKSFDFDNKHNVDCLVCHDQSGQYAKGGGGLPQKSVDLTAAAKSVGYSTRKNCGTCHFSGGGGNAVKHGDLDESMYYPSPRIDIHMGKFDFQCTDCHTTSHHNITGRSMSVSVSQENGFDCTQCHDNAPHNDTRLNLHTEKIACQTCHIPEVAKKTPTKTEWDWSQAGKDKEEDPHHYLKIKGEFVYNKHLKPEYYWYNGNSKLYISGQKIDPTKRLAINEPLGSRSIPGSKIWPFKVHKGKQIYDSKNKYLLQPKTVGGYWKHFDWDKALKDGSKNMGIAYSGSYGFVETEMYWPLSHMVSDKNNSLTCVQCHSENSVLNWETLGYDGDPMRTKGGY